jgi:hypothetical protein
MGVESIGIARGAHGGQALAKGDDWTNQSDCVKTTILALRWCA